ncbi:unnamed product, partial [Ostreococcus tauri]
RSGDVPFVVVALGSLSARAVDARRASVVVVVVVVAPYDRRAARTKESIVVIVVVVVVIVIVVIVDERAIRLDRPSHMRGAAGDTALSRKRGWHEKMIDEHKRKASKGEQISIRNYLL